MSPALDRLVALAAALAPDRAERLLLRLARGGPAAAARAAALARGGRAGRLAAVAAAFAEPSFAELAAAHPLLARLAREERAPADP